jgi:tRNA pseudouridine38-40 synthase
VATFKITLAYDGTNYVGWQRQASGASIQGLIEEALMALDDRAVVVAGAGRTDAGVHALGQVASFSLHREIDGDALMRALNARLPSDVRVLRAEAAAPGFHARFNATAKTYRYRFFDGPVLNPFERRYVWHVGGPLDLAAMDAAAQLLEGRHDFAAFRSVGGAVRTTERTIMRSRVRSAAGGSGPDGDTIAYEITGDGFLRHMVRAIAGTLVEIGRGRWPSGRMREVLESRDRNEGGPTAPPGGLFLVAVEYADL